MSSKHAIHLLVLLLSFSLLTPAAVRAEGGLWTGEQWRVLPQEIKIAYIKGVGNLADYENAASGDRVGVVSWALQEEWRQKTISQIVREVDRWYEQNPRQMSAPVIEVVLRCCSGLEIP